MSDTPKIDKACGWPMGHHGHIESSDLVMDIAGPFVHSSVARELERENAALRAEVKVTRQNYESFKADNIGLRAAIAESEEFARKNGETLVAKAMELLAENAALRADKERLDWLDQKIVSSWLDGKDFVVWDKSSPQPCSIREWLDAERKEAQP